jgi:hypothetical protein
MNDLTAFGIQVGILLPLVVVAGLVTRSVRWDLSGGGAFGGAERRGESDGFPVRRRCRRCALPPHSKFAPIDSGVTSENPALGPPRPQVLITIFASE